MNLAALSPWDNKWDANNQVPAGGSNGKLRRFESVNCNRWCGHIGRQPYRIF